MSISALPTGRFTFEGFLSTNKKARRAHLDSLKDERRTMIFYEAPHKLTDTLKSLADAFGSQRRISLCRELTKLHEEVLRFTMEEAMRYYEEQAPRGEYVLVVEGAPEVAQEALGLEELLQMVDALVDEGLSKKDAVKQISAQTGFPKNELYHAYIKKEL